jgi:hypothetical protein
MGASQRLEHVSRRFFTVPGQHSISAVRFRQQRTSETHAMAVFYPRLAAFGSYHRSGPHVSLCGSFMGRARLAFPSVGTLAAAHPIPVSVLSPQSSPRLAHASSSLPISPPPLAVLAPPLLHGRHGAVVSPPRASRSEFYMEVASSPSVCPG